ncbi:MAG: cell division ATP-binding protein FtsE [Gammaproteobacteria bacterium]|nr:cell division ATP-binding protein FtsE [Gammaproteobacteria bacterium]
MIHFTDVSKSFAGQYALNNLNLQIASGEMTFLTGHSGAGKTTLLKLITMIENCTRGQIIVNGKNLSRLSRRQIPDYRRHIGMIFQDTKLIPNHNVFDNVALPLIISGFNPHEIKRRVHAALDKVGLLDKENLFPGALSGGEAQRVGIARAVVNRPTLILADEPTGNLDPELSAEILRLFEAFNAVGVTTLIATHDTALISKLNHRIITLKNGMLAGDHHVQ